MNKLELGIKEAKKLFKQFAKDNYLEFIEENGCGDYYTNEEQLDYTDMSYLEEFVRNNSNLSFDDMIDKLYENYIADDSDIIGTEYYRDNFLVEYDKQLSNLFQDTDYEDNHDMLFIDDYIVIRNEIDYAEALENVELEVLVYLENEDSFNHEMGNNDFFNIFYNNNDFYELQDDLFDSSLNLLLNSQGYSLEDFVWYHVVDEINIEEKSDIEKFEKLSGDKTFTSIYNEVMNAQNNQSLVVPTCMTISELEKINSAENYIVKRDSVIGYFGAVSGSGSVFDIKLNKDIEVHKGEFKVIEDGNYGYSMREVYGDFIG